jgi:glycosyltransferase involved in cell wall biosynthesis
MHTPLVSVGIPFFNREKCLIDSIRSIFAQTFQDWELILVDDGSTDKSLELAQSIDDPKVRVLPPDGINKRLPARLNQIVQVARGQFIAHMHSDDLCHPERFATQLEFFNSHPDVDVVGTSSYILDQHRQPMQKLIVPETHQDIFKDKVRFVSVCHPTVMARSQWFRRFHYMETLFATEDYELWLRSCNSSVFANVLKPLYFKDDLLFFSFTKYARSKLTGAKVIKAYHAPELSKSKFISYTARRYWQIARYAVYTMLGLSHLLVQRRYQPLALQESLEANRALDAIKQTDIPIRNKKMMSSGSSSRLMLRKK